MTHDLRHHLQSTLGDAYTLERELGGGGMSRVFVATETTLERKVVVKVLPPELAADISADRFRREIQVAARLQHPHIVPVLSAGASGGLLYYTMPFVEGESLRETLNRLTQLPVDDALRIAREVADALDCAHRSGVVHRDIKPENILLEDGHAVVADFGIARALSQAADAQALTGTGITLGTPTYMSPEQASGEKELDGRSDIYSLGCVLYEMLAGEPPFTGPTAQAVIAKRFTSEPPSVRLTRESVPAPVEAAVAKALARVPADRFPTAKEFARALAGTTSAAQPAAAAAARRPPLRTLALAGAAAVLLAAPAAVWVLKAPRRVYITANPNVVAVLPFRTAGADPSLGYLREGMIDLLAAKLTGEGGPRAADPRSVVSLWRRTVGAEEADPTEDVALGIAQRLGAGRLLLGSIVGTPTRLEISARLLTVPGGKVRAEESVRGSPDSLPVLIDRLAAQLLTREAGEGERLAVLTSTSLPALRFYLEGQAAYRQGRYEQSVRHFERALQLDSTFALAAIGLFSAAYWTPNPEPLLRGERLAWAARERLSARDRAYLLAWTGPRFPEPPSFGEILAGWQRAVDAAPDRPEPWFELGDAFYHWGPLLGVSAPAREARKAFEQALALDSGFAAPLGHLVELAAAERDTVGARRLAALYFAQDSAADVADFVRWRMAVALRDGAALDSLRARMRAVSTGSLRRIVGFGQLDGAGLDDAARAVEALRGRAATGSERAQIHLDLRNFALNRGRPAEALAETRAYAQLEPYPDAALDLQLLDALFGGGDTTAAERAARRLASAADGAAAPSPDARQVRDTHLCAVELWRLMRGDARGTPRAIARLLAAGGEAEPGTTGIDYVVCAATLDALLASAQRRPDAPAAIDRLEQALGRSGPATFGGGPTENIGRLVLARLRAEQGDIAGALAVLRRRAYQHLAVTYLAASLREEGRLAARVGDRAGAARSYRHYLALRADAEPAVRAEVEAVRRELERLQQ